MRPLLAGLAVMALAACSAAPKGSPVAESAPAPTPAPSVAVSDGTTREAIDLAEHCGFDQAIHGTFTIFRNCLCPIGYFGIRID